MDVPGETVLIGDGEFTVQDNINNQISYYTLRNICIQFLPVIFAMASGQLLGKILYELYMSYE